MSEAFDEKSIMLYGPKSFGLTKENGLTDEELRHLVFTKNVVLSYGDVAAIRELTDWGVWAPAEANPPYDRFHRKALIYRRLTVAERQKQPPEEVQKIDKKRPEFGRTLDPIPIEDIIQLDEPTSETLFASETLFKSKLKDIAVKAVQASNGRKNLRVFIFGVQNYPKGTEIIKWTESTIRTLNLTLGFEFQIKRGFFDAGTIQVRFYDVL